MIKKKICTPKLIKGQLTLKQPENRERTKVLINWKIKVVQIKKTKGKPIQYSNQKSKDTSDR